jgi:integrase
VARSRRVPTYRLHKSSGQAIVVLDGKFYYLGSFGSLESRADYNRLLAEWLSSGRATPPRPPSKPAPSDLVVNELVLRYWRHVEQHYRKDGRPTSQVHVVKAALRPVRKLYGHVTVRDFGPAALKACRTSMVVRGLSRKTVNSLVARIRSMFRWAVAEELVPVEVFSALESVDGLRKGRTEALERPPVGPVPDAWIEATLAHCCAQVAAMIQLQQFAGMRPGEVVAMRTTDLTTSGTVWEYRPASHKNEHHDKRRVIMLGPRAQTVLRPWLRTNLEEPLFQPVEAERARLESLRAARKSPLWPSHATAQARKRKAKKRREPGDRYSVASYRKAIARACRKAGTEPWSPHQLRHGAAT